MEPRARYVTRRTAVVAVTLAILAITVLLASIANAQNVRSPEFVLVQAWSQLANPTGVRFTANGRVFIMGKGGIIYTADNVEDQTVKVAADISTQVFNNFDKGLVGLAPHPDFPTNRHVYLLYARDGEIGGAVPIFNDLCPSGICFTSGALARMTWDPEQEILTNLEEIIVDWCSGSTTHAMGDLRFDAQRNLIFSAGDNTFFSNALNFGENPPNRCPFGDPADPESGGVMQCQSPAATSGKLLYIPLAELNAWQRGQPAPQLRELARGFRNPYRFAVDPATNGFYLGDVGFGEWEEINFIPPVGSGPVRNYGWPCFEGTLVQPSVQSRQFARCEALYRNPETHSRAAFQYSHFDTQVGNAVTRAGGASAVTAIGFSSRDGFPVSYRNSLFWADYTRGGFWAVRRNATGLDWDNMQMMVDGMSQIVDITEGPDGALYVSQVWAGIVWRFNAASRERPVVRITPSARSGALPLTVQFSSAGTLDTTGGSLSYAWDLDGSGQFAGPATPSATFTYTQAGPVTVSLRVRSSSVGNPTNNASVTIFPASALSGSISFNVSDWAFAIGDNIRFSADIRTETNAVVPASNFQWQVLISHCYPGPECTNTANCHQHLVNAYSGVASETLSAPDHEYPSDLEFVLRVRHLTYPDLVQTFTRRLQPNFVNAQVTTNPPGLDVILNIFRYTSPVTLPNLQNGELSLDALSPQMINRQGYRFTGWSQGGNATQVIRPVNGTVYTANYETFTIGNHPAGQGPPAPTGLAVAPDFRQCTVTWASVTDQTNPVTGYIVYHREVKAGETLPTFSSALVPATTNSFKMTVDTGSRCEFSVSASTAVGESSFRSAVVGAQSNHLPPVGAEWCPDTRCRYRTVLVDDFSAGTSPRNVLGLLQEGELLSRFEVTNGKLEVSAQGTGTYFYSLMGTAAQCFDSSQFTHLTFKVTAQPGWTLRVGMDSKDSTCTSFLAKREVNAASWTPEGAFTGQEQTVSIPLSEISNNPQGVQSIFFNTFTPGQIYRFDDLYFVNRCTTTPGACTTLGVERYTSLDANQLGYWTGVESVTRTIANGVMTLRATAADGYWATLISGNACRNLTQFGSIRFNIQPVSGTAYPNIQLQQRLADCSGRDPEGTVTVPLAPYVVNGVATVPLSAFAATNLARGHGIVLNGFPVGVDFTVSNLDLVCAAPPTTTSATATTTSPTTTTTTSVPGSCPSPIVMDTFATVGENAFGLWSGGEGATITYTGNQMTLRATAADAYFASLVSAVACRDLSTFTALRFGLTAPAGAALPMLHVQARNAACTSRDAAVNALVPLTPTMIANGIVTVPIPAFSATVAANRIHALALSGFALNQDYVFSSMQWVCTATSTTATSATTTSTTTTTSTATTTTTVPGTCPSPLVADTFATPEQNAFGLWAFGESATFSYANNQLTLRASAADAYYASVISGTGCRDLTAFSVLQFGLAAPAGAALPMLQIQARAASCTGPRDPAINAMIPLTPAMVVNGVVSVPFSAFTTTVPANRIHALALTGWTVGQDYVLSNMRFVCLPSSTTATISPTSTSGTVPTTTPTTPLSPTTSTSTVTVTSTTTTASSATLTVTPVPCSPLTIDTFAVIGRNEIGSWGGGEGAIVSYANNRASITATSGDAYFAENLSGPTECSDLSSFSALQFGITPASGTAFPTTIALQLKNTACNARDPGASIGVPFGRYVVGNVATVPLSAFATANLRLGHAMVLTGWPLNVEYGLTNMRLICATAPPAPASTATIAPTVNPTSTPTTATTTPTTVLPAPTCSRLVIDTFIVGTTINDLGQTTTRSPTSAITRTAGNTLTIVSTATNGATWTSVVSTATSCRDVRGFSHLQFQIRGPAGSSLAVRLEYVDATVANCQTRGTAPLRTASVRVVPTGMTRTTTVTVRVPLANLVGLVQNKVHAYGLTGFGVGTFVVSNVQFVSSVCPAAT